MWLKWRLKWSPGGACRVDWSGLPSLTLIYSSKKQSGKTQAATEREERSVGEQQPAQQGQKVASAGHYDTQNAEKAQQKALTALAYTSSCSMSCHTPRGTLAIAAHSGPRALQGIGQWCRRAA